MPRPRMFRRVLFEPNVNYFKPVGIRMVDLEETVLAVDEFEAVRLKDLEGLDQEESAKKMNISQPTFNRLILSARKKIADSIVNAKAIRIEGGNFHIGYNASCFCPSCGNRVAKVKGMRCLDTKCPKCGSIMVR